MKQSLALILALTLMSAHTTIHAQTSKKPRFEQLIPHFETLLTETPNHLDNFQDMLTKSNIEQEISQIKVQSFDWYIDPYDEEDSPPNSGTIQFVLLNENNQNILGGNYTLTCKFRFFNTRDDAAAGLAIFRDRLLIRKYGYPLEKLIAVLDFEDLELD